MGSESKPNFIKPFIPEMTSIRLRIPLGFMVYIKDENSQTFFLTGPSGNVWTVGLIQDVDDDGDYFFEEGWSDFRKDHALELGDICVLIYEGNLYFTVQILDQTECEKESAFHAICSQDSTCSKRNKGKKACESSHRSSKRKTKLAANVISRADLRSGTIISRRRQVTAEEKSRALEAANVFESNNPFAVIVMRPSYVYSVPTLRMPNSFTDLHLPKSEEQMILRDPCGQLWFVRYVVRDDKVGWLSRGWGAFSYDNNLEEGDVCILELIEENKMQVHIFRVVEEITPLLKSSIRKDCGKRGSMI